MASKRVEEPGDERRNVAARADEDDHHAWRHPVVSLSDEAVVHELATLESSVSTASDLERFLALLSRFAEFCATTCPDMLGEDLRSKMNLLEPSEWRKFARDYAKAQPEESSTPMFKLDQISDVFFTWLEALSIKDEEGESKDVSYALRKSCCSAMAWLFDLFGVLSDDFDARVSSVLHKYKLAHRRAVARVSAGENEPLTFVGYFEIAEKLMKAPDVKSLFAHAVFTTIWNLMSELDNGSKIHKSHLQWNEDALVIIFENEKLHQIHPRHIYANPDQPQICPILSLGMLFLLVDITSSADDAIFSGQNQCCPFGSSLSTFVKTEMRKQGLPSLGKHSIRIGSTLYAGSSSTVNPPFTATSNRSGWGLGNLLPPSPIYDQSNDQYVGRILCGLNNERLSFAILPPRFRSNYDPKPLLRRLFSGFDRASPGLQEVLTMTTASVIYHMDWLRSNLPSGHCLLSSALFKSDLLAAAPNDIVECHGWKPGDAEKATGIPLHVLKMFELLEEICQMQVVLSGLEHSLR